MQEVDHQISSKLPHLGTTIFTTMSALAAEHNAINLSQGFPDFAVDEELVSLVGKHMRAGKNQYAHMKGAIELRVELCKKLAHSYGRELDPEKNITITAGATQAIFTAILATIKEDDEVILIQPAYDCYEPAISLAGGRTIYYNMEIPGYTINWDELRKLINPKTRMIIINTPHNPTGSVLRESDMQQLEAIAQSGDILVLSDEVYEHIIFNGESHESVLKYNALFEKSIAVFSFGKTFHCTGWKLGYAVGPEYLMKEFNKVHQYNVFCVNHPLQLAIAEYISDNSKFEELPSFYEEKRNLFVDGLKKTGFDVFPCDGTYFVTASYNGLMNKKDIDFCKWLTTDIGVAAIPLSPFYNTKTDNQIIRFCFAKNASTLQKAIDSLCKI